MKKGILFVLVWLFALVGFFSFVYAAQIVDVVGKAQIQSASSTSWRSAKVGMKVSIGDKIRTARRSKVRVVLDEQKKSFISIEELTMVILNSTIPDEINKFDLSKGKLYVKVEKVKAGATFEVATPSAIAGVRGTAWSVDSKKDRDIVAVYESKVFVQAFDKNKNLISEITVPEGFKTIIERFGPPSKLLPLTHEERGSWNKVKKRFLDYLQGFKGAGLDKLGDLADELSNLQDKIEDIQEQIEEQNIRKIIEERTSGCQEEHEYYGPQP
ncbi:MAG: FecR domain-containing protein [Candidatus Omnitrophica bacterium]|nr:FecR domain-containing protein [Candidatus Omnitrophota bacterium]